MPNNSKNATHIKTNYPYQTITGQALNAHTVGPPCTVYLFTVLFYDYLKRNLGKCNWNGILKFISLINMRVLLVHQEKLLKTQTVAHVTCYALWWLFFLIGFCKCLEMHSSFTCNIFAWNFQPGLCKSGFFFFFLWISTLQMISIFQMLDMYYTIKFLPA